MSRVGTVPVEIPSGVQVEISPKEIIVKGPKGQLSQFTMPEVVVKQEGETLIVTRKSDEKTARAKHGLMRSLLQNMIEGVNQGFEKKLEVNGVGFKVAAAGQDLKMSLGYSHETVYKVPEGLQLGVDGNTISISGSDKQKVGQVAAEIRALRKPEPYKGKGIMYEGEQIIRKAGKAAAGGEG